MEWWWLETKAQEQTAEQQSKTYINTHCILSHCTHLIWHTSAHCHHLWFATLKKQKSQVQTSQLQHWEC
jgi:hypothetical protein